MNNNLKLVIHTRLEQQLKLNQQQVLRAELLQLPLLELQQKIEAELNQNPMLELVDPDDTENTDLEDNVGLADIPTDEFSQPIETTLAKEMNQDEATIEELELAYLDKSEPEKISDVDWERIFGNQEDNYIAPRGVLNKEEDEESTFEYHAVQDWTENLKEQLHQNVFDEKQIEIGEYLIGLLLPSGLLPKDAVAVTANEFGISEEEVLKVIQILQTFDPPGIFATSLQESLILQLERKKEEVKKSEELEKLYQKAIILLKKYYHEILNKRFELLLKNEKISEEELKKIFHLYQSLQPHPGYGNEKNEYIIPEFQVTATPLNDQPPSNIVENDEGQKLYIYLNDHYLPEIRISKTYRAMFQDKKLDKQTKMWLEQKFDAARSFVKAMYQRKNTLLEIITAIVKVQFNFFIQGDEIQPLMQMQIAEMTGLDNSTVSRAVKDKYVETDFGIYPLKQFFSFSISSTSGEDIATSEVKHKLTKIIENEDKKNPYSDQALADELFQLGYRIARRTVQKYREQLGIPPQKLRKVL
ncbi:MAG: RNA polymerase factor sigma-54 [bacterium]|nr:RNA polymerase factor sigma-54 [bacterium]